MRPCESCAMAPRGVSVMALAEGWRCPSCGHCYAPRISECHFCGAQGAAYLLLECEHPEAEVVENCTGRRCGLCGEALPMRVPSEWVKGARWP